MLIETILSNLSPDETRALHAVLVVPRGRFDPERTQCDHSGPILKLTLVSKGDKCCPLEVVVLRRDAYSTVSIFVGLGAEIFNDESIRTRGEQETIGSDLARLLASPVQGRRWIQNRQIVKETYTFERARMGHHPLTVTYRVNGAGLRTLFSERVAHEYEPWVRSGEKV